MTRQRWWAVGVLLLLQAGDLVSTKLALSNPSIVELNPVGRWLGLWPEKVLAAATAVAIVLIVKKLRRAWYCAGYYGLVVSSNLWLYWSHR